MLKKIVSILIMFFCLNANADINNIKPTNYHSFYNFYKFALDDEAGKFIFIDDHDGILSRYIITIEPNSLIADYKENELLANKKYRGKLLRIKTVASAIGVDLLRRSYVTANDKDSNESLYLVLNNKNYDKFLALSKGNKIDFICIGDGMSLGLPTLKDCDHIAVYLNNFKSSALQSIKKIENEYYLPNSKFDARLVALYKVYEKSIASECEKSVKQCRDALLKASEDESYDIEQAKQHYDSDLRELGRYTEKMPDLPYLKD